MSGQKRAGCISAITDEAGRRRANCSLSSRPACCSRPRDLFFYWTLSYVFSPSAFDRSQCALILVPKYSLALTVVRSHNMLWPCRGVLNAYDKWHHRSGSRHDLRLNQFSKRCGLKLSSNRPNCGYLDSFPYTSRTIAKTSRFVQPPSTREGLSWHTSAVPLC